MKHFVLAMLFVWCGSCRPHGSILCFPITYEDGSTTETYTYLGWRLISVTREDGSATYTTLLDYDHQGLVIGKRTEGNGDTTATAYTYDGRRKLVKAVVVAPHHTETILYTYNESGQLVTAVNTQEIPGGVLTVTDRYTYPNIFTANPATITQVISNGATNNYSFLYDNKVHPLRGLFPELPIVNNITQVTKNGVTTTYTYQYNSVGYPISGTTNSGITLAWTYGCQEI